MKSRAREQASSSIPLRGRHERGAEKNGKQMRSQVASRSENHDGKQQDMTTHEQNAKSDRQTRPEPAHNSHKSKTNDTPRPPRVRPRGQDRERKKWSIWYYVVQFSSGTSELGCGLAIAGWLLSFCSKNPFVQPGICPVTRYLQSASQVIGGSIHRGRVCLGCDRRSPHLSVWI